MKTRPFNEFKLGLNDAWALLALIEDRISTCRAKANESLQQSDLGMVDHWREQLEQAERQHHALWFYINGNDPEPR